MADILLLGIRCRDELEYQEPGEWTQLRWYTRQVAEKRGKLKKESSL